MSFGTLGNKLKEYFNVIDDVRKLQTTLPIKVEIPQIAVIGNQSVGKSSVLEMLTGVRLPQGKGIVTRCPILLKIRRSELKIIEVDGQRISQDNLAQKLIDAQNLNLAGGDNFEDDPTILSKVVDVTITVDIHGPDLCDLTLVDLPGIQYGVSSEMTMSIKDMIIRFIEPESTLILIVSACAADPTTTEALLLAKAFDPDRKRSIFILTKPDEAKIDDKSSDLLSLIDGRHTSLNFPLGVFVIKGRDISQEDDGIAEVRQSEKEYFQNHPIFGRSSKSLKWGHANVRKNIEKLILEKMKKSLPEIWNELRKTLQALKFDLKEIESKRLPTDETEIRTRLLRMLSAINEEMISSIKFQLEGDYFFLFQQLESDVVNGLRKEENKDEIIAKISKFPSLSPNGFPRIDIFTEIYKLHYMQMIKFGDTLIKDAGNLLEIESDKLLCKLGKIYSLHERLLEIRAEVFKKIDDQLLETFGRFVESSNAPYQATFMKFFRPEIEQIPINFTLYTNDESKQQIPETPFSEALDALADNPNSENDKLHVCDRVTDIFIRKEERHPELRDSVHISSEFENITKELEQKKLEGEIVYRNYRSYLISAGLVFLQVAPQLVTYYYLKMFPIELYSCLLSDLENLVVSIKPDEDIEEAYLKTTDEIFKIEKTIQSCQSLIG